MSTLRGRLLPALLVGWILLASAQAAAARLYRWKDRYGNTQYADQPPPGQDLPGSELEVTRFRNPTGALVKLRLEASGAGYLAYADNMMHGPVQVALRFKQQRNVSARPALPATTLVPARSSMLLATLAIKVQRAAAASSCCSMPCPAILAPGLGTTTTACRSNMGGSGSTRGRAAASATVTCRTCTRSTSPCPKARR